MELPQITVSSRAASIFKDTCAAENQSMEDSYLRVSAISGGCSGYKYGLELQTPEDVKDTDVCFVSNEVHVVVDRQSLVDLLGPLELDYTDDNLVEQGFVFKQESGRQCGCGESFTPYKERNTWKPLA